MFSKEPTEFKELAFSKAIHHISSKGYTSMSGKAHPNCMKTKVHPIMFWDFTISYELILPN